MAKISPAAPKADGVNNAVANAVQEVVINAAPVAIPVASPDNTPVPGGGRWAWDYAHACWVETPAPVIESTLE